MSPSKEEIAERARRDSTARAESQAAEKERLERQKAIDANYQQELERTARTPSALFNQDSLVAGDFVLENEKIRLTLNGRGGRITSVQLKEYRTHDSLPLMLWKERTSQMGLQFYARGMQVNTEDLIFSPVSQRTKLTSDEQTLTLRAYVEEDKYLEYSYSLASDSYMADFRITAHHLHDVIAGNTNFLNLNWSVQMPQLEKSKDFENRYTGVYYRFSQKDVDNLSLNGDEKLSLTNQVKWVAFKQQFFSSVLVSGDHFSNVIVSSAMNKADGKLKNVSAELALPFSGAEQETYNMQFYFGPNQYNILREYGKEIDFPDLVNLGWKWLAWFNRYLVIPIFHFLEKHVTQNYGLIILLLTLIIKLLLFPMTYKSYLSQAKMRVLKPQIDEINARIPADKAMERQQATMNLYKKAGVNPMGGCLPMLVQMPILIALFWFFPGAIELRQKSFLWATDLASYDSILDLPFSIPFYGDHVSLFCLLMTITNIIYSVMNQKNQPQNDQMKSMQMMMYLMPVMFLFIFNSYSSGLSYYYLVSTLITITQTWAIRKVVDDEKLLKRMEQAKTKPVKKSNFQKRLEEAQKEQARRLKAQQQNKKR